MLTHTGEKPFHCPYCPYKAALKFNLVSHIKNIHKSVPSSNCSSSNTGSSITSNSNTSSSGGGTGVRSSTSKTFQSYPSPPLLPFSSTSPRDHLLTGSQLPISFSHVAAASIARRSLDFQDATESHQLTSNLTTSLQANATAPKSVSSTEPSSSISPT